MSFISHSEDFSDWGKPFIAADTTRSYSQQSPAKLCWLAGFARFVHLPRKIRIPHFNLSFITEHHRIQRQLVQFVCVTPQPKLKTGTRSALGLSGHHRLLPVALVLSLSRPRNSLASFCRQSEVRLCFLSSRPSLSSTPNQLISSVRNDRLDDRDGLAKHQFSLTSRQDIFCAKCRP